ncbi:MAG TPA: hypothetical protein VGB57_04540 [Allosphingosinicella sp.]|jgi:hypothetical protein
MIRVADAMEVESERGHIAAKRKSFFLRRAFAPSRLCAFYQKPGGETVEVQAGTSGRVQGEAGKPHIRHLFFRRSAWLFS